jgi:hypothetical protein
VLRVASLALALVAPQPFQSTIEPVPASVRAEITKAGLYHRGCPVTFAQLRLLTVSHWGFDGQIYDGQLVVNRKAAQPLAKVFRRLYALRFRIHHMQLDDSYGGPSAWPADRDSTDAFECRKAVPSPCGGSGTGNWSNHAYGLAVDINPIENPYVGCGATRERGSIPYLNRKRIRRGMVTPAVVRAFASVGWGWGGAWSGSTKDYMHFSVNGR